MKKYKVMREGCKYRIEVLDLLYSIHGYRPRVRMVPNLVTGFFTDRIDYKYELILFDTLEAAIAYVDAEVLAETPLYEVPKMSKALLETKPDTDTKQPIRCSKCSNA